MIELQNVSKRYGRVTAIDDLSLTIEENGIYILLGRNGAGKTTLMKLIAGHIGATGGAIAVCGKRVSMAHMPACVSFAESGSDQFNMRVSELIEAAGTIRDGFDLAFARRMAEKFALDGRKRYKQLSFGMRTMLSTILTLAGRSKITLLDEPVLGFDAIMREQFNALLLESYEAYPRVIIVSTHLIDEIAKVAERLIIIEKGKCLLRTDIGDIDEHAYVLTGPADAVAPLLENLNCIGQSKIGGMLAAYIYDERIPAPAGVQADRLSLQDFFIKLVGEEIHHER
ncbi:MAG: ABC transporter ATP-binding protein [Clostridiales Family XIII bacterium]|jgi:ABC-2 type transport system ATP-binding protein|nr:ABC transporter ATP-binding protein [Clostridiales Family XIII bacterium]